MANTVTVTCRLCGQTVAAVADNGNLVAASHQGPNGRHCLGSGCPGKEAAA